MLRAVFLWLSEQPRIFGFVRRNGLARKLASRFVAGETVDAAITAARELNGKADGRGLSVSLDLLGESVLQAVEAQRACATYLELLDRIHRDDPPVDRSGPGRGRQPAVPACPRAQSQHALTAAYAAGLPVIAVSVPPRRTRSGPPVVVAGTSPADACDSCKATGST